MASSARLTPHDARGDPGARWRHPALEFVATVKALAPSASVPTALVAWLNGAPPDSMLPPIYGFASDDERRDFDVRR